MYSQEINQYLIARLIAIQNAFSKNGFPYRANKATNQNIQNAKEVIKIKTSDKGEGDGGGGGTARGLRTNPLQKAKEALRRMTRSK